MTNSIDNIKKTINENSAVMLYFSGPTCSVCKSLKPKILDMINQNFGKFEIISIDISAEQEVATNFNVFAIPTVLVYLDGKEFLRKSRHMSVDEVKEEIKRPYEIMMP